MRPKLSCSVTFSSFRNRGTVILAGIQASTPAQHDPYASISRNPPPGGSIVDAIEGRFGGEEYEVVLGKVILIGVVVLFVA